MKQSKGLVLPGYTVYCERNYLSPWVDAPLGFETEITVELADPVPGTAGQSPTQWN